MQWYFSLKCHHSKNYKYVKESSAIVMDSSVNTVCSPQLIKTEQKIENNPVEISELQVS